METKIGGFDFGLNEHPELYTPKDELDSLAIKHGTDKTAYYIHDYAPFYHSLYKNRRNEVKKVLEIGIGFGMEMLIPNYKMGASLYMWRDYFPNAEIYGFDIEEKAMFQEDRIHTKKGNQGNSGDLFDIIECWGKDWDLIVDDGSHNRNDQLISAIVLMPYLKPNSYYVIENVCDPEYIVSQLKYFGYKIEMKQFNPEIWLDTMLVITK